MKNLKFGVGIFPSEPSEEAVALALAAEDAGYDTVWVGDSHMIWREMSVLLGYMAARTKRVVISSGVTQLVTRHPTVTASALITLAELTGGRVRLGLGLGDSSVRNLGQRSSNLSALGEGVHLMRSLWEGKSVRVNGKDRRITFARNLRIPIYIASNTPTVLELAGTLADGVILAGDSSSLGARIDLVRQAQQNAGRSREDLRIVWWRACCVSNDPQEAREAVKPMVARAAFSELKRRIKRGQTLNEEEQSVLDQLKRHYDFYHHMGPEHTRLVPDGWVDHFALAGSPSQVLASIQEKVKEGIDEISIIPFAKDRRRVVYEFAEETMKALQKERGH